MRFLLFVLFFNFFLINSFANEKDLNLLINFYYQKKEYYNVITESKRYRFLYPNGKNSSNVLLLMGLSYYNGENYNLAVGIFSYCYNRYPVTPAGERSAYLLGAIRLRKGAPFFAIRNLNEYQYVFTHGQYLQETKMELAYSSALILDFESAQKEIYEYKSIYPNGEYIDKMNWLNDEIVKQKKRPQKKIWIAGLGSLVVPGFGYFYTGKNSLGTLALLSNVALASLAYRGYRKDNNFQMVFFSVLGFTFYQYSIVGSVKSVYEYNGNSAFQKKIKMSLTKEF